MCVHRELWFYFIRIPHQGSNESNSGFIAQDLNHLKPLQLSDISNANISKTVDIAIIILPLQSQMHIDKYF